MKLTCNRVGVGYIFPSPNCTIDEDKERLRILQSRIARKRAKMLLKARIMEKLKKSQTGRQLLLERKQFKEGLGLGLTYLKYRVARELSKARGSHVTIPQHVLSTYQVPKSYRNRRISLDEKNSRNLDRYDYSSMENTRPIKTISCLIQE